MILSRASEVGSPTNNHGLQAATGHGPGILLSLNRWTKPDTYGGASNLWSFTKAPQDLTYYTDSTKTEELHEHGSEMVQKWIVTFVLPLQSTKYILFYSILYNKLPKNEKDGPTTGPVLQMQGEPGTSQYDMILVCRAAGVHFSMMQLILFWMSWGHTSLYRRYIIYCHQVVPVSTYKYS